MDVRMLKSHWLKPKLFPYRHERLIFDKNNKSFKSKINIYKKQHHRISATKNSEDNKSKDYYEMWMPHEKKLETVANSGDMATVSTSPSDHKPQTPPPDLPSLLLDSRIVYLGMPMVPAVTELIIAEIFYLQYKDINKPIFFYINSTGTTRADGETVGFETEGMAILDTLLYVTNEVHTVGVGVAIGQACMLLSAGKKGKRFMLPNATAMLHQPRVPPTGQRQAIEIHIKWREVLAQKQDFLNVLSKTTGHSISKLDQDIQRPLYMTAIDAIEYGIVDKIVKSEKEARMIDQVKQATEWDKDAGIVTRQVPQQ